MAWTDDAARRIDADNQDMAWIPVSDVEAALTHIVRVTLESHGREVGAKALMRKPFERDLLIGVLEAVITAA